MYITGSWICVQVVINTFAHCCVLDSGKCAQSLSLSLSLVTLTLFWSCLRSVFGKSHDVHVALGMYNRKLDALDGVLHSLPTFVECTHWVHWCCIFYLSAQYARLMCGIIHCGRDRRLHSIGVYKGTTYTIISTLHIYVVNPIPIAFSSRMPSTTTTTTSMVRWCCGKGKSSWARPNQIPYDRTPLLRYWWWQNDCRIHRRMHYSRKLHERSVLFGFSAVHAACIV